ncbi:hypothetical protein KR009_009038 [Drosophila setifemur]|nr:hypothetical protein KR009_009038 [Drosophila setifemur]
MDIHRLIAEVRQRPALWDPTHPDHSNRNEAQRLWRSVADALEQSVDLCRSKWKNLRCSYRRLHRRGSLSKSQLPASPSPSHPWTYAEGMSFLDAQRLREDSGTNEDDETEPEMKGDEGKMKMTEPECILTFKTEERDQMEADNDALMQEFQNAATPQALRRLSQNISLASAAAEESNLPESKVMVGGIGGRGMGLGTGMGLGLGASPKFNQGSAMAAAAASSCHCSKRVDEQVNFLEGLEREEQQLMQSTSQDLARCKSVLHVGDSDYNYLVSFLPLMKQMTPIQNVFFRAKMGELLLQTMQQPPMAPQQQQQMMQQQLQHQLHQEHLQQQQHQEQQQQEEQQQQQQRSQMLLNQEQMALDQAQVSTSSTNWS